MTTRARKGQVQLDVVSLVNEHPEGIKASKIAELLGRSPSQIHGVVKRLGLRREGGLVFPNETTPPRPAPRPAPKTPRGRRSRRKPAGRAMTGPKSVKADVGAGGGLDGHGQELVVRFAGRGVVIDGDVGYVRRQPDGSVFVGLRRPEDLVHGHQPQLETGVEYPVAPGSKRSHFGTTPSIPPIAEIW